MIGVKNNTKETLTARYDGESFEFPAGGPAVVLSPDAARHIFGFGLEDKKAVLQRLGWMRNLDAYDDAMKRLAGFQFLAVEQKVTEPVKIPSTLRQEEVPVLKKNDGSESKLEIPQLAKK